ncbi:indole-3-glycerol phosphate synthase TrpC [Cellulosilyticum sp. ST5]|uniref:indole-3-glycerol phosphate synthase TrpC n=1 Tax=Cellulosilyticum sp. ST5 TaxID=3055805 RepID=UPI0039776670
MILDQIIADRKRAVAALKERYSTSQLMGDIEFQNFATLDFKKALKREDERSIHIIAEVKKASPSKGLICQEFDYLTIAKDYEIGGASAISVLTEPKYFQGDNRYLTTIKEKVRLPILRKDFIIDEWQIYEAKSIGADAILLIVAALSETQLRSYLSLAKSLNLQTLVETHDEREVDIALVAGAEIIGVNNRNLRTFEVRLETSIKLRALVPKDKVFVAESGIHTTQDMALLKEIGCDAALIGESLMTAPNRVEKLQLFKGAY